MRVISQASIIGLLVGSFNMAVAQAPMERTVERTVTAVPNKDTRIGVYLNVLPRKDREGEGHQLQGLPCARGACLCRVLQIAAGIFRRRCSDD